MKRLDWTLIRPPRPGKKISKIEDIEGRIDARVREATRRVLTPDEVDRLADLEDRLDNLTIASCEAAHAPRVEDDPHWESRIVDEYAEADTDYELEEYLELRRREFDCERCPHAAPYSLYPQDPCEISVGPLLDALVDAALVEKLTGTMGPEDMRALADELEAVRQAGRFAPVDGLDAADLLDKSITYLRFWGRLGFGLRPELVDDEDPIQTPDGPVGPPSSDSSTLLH